MHARSALFDLYGDHLRTRGGEAPVAALVRLMSALGIAAPAVRTAVSRMVRQGWLTPVALPQGPGYALTAKGVHRLEDAGERVYRSSDLDWDGRWHLLVTSRVASRTTRQRLDAQLPFLGYAQVADRMWVAPRPHEDADGLILAEGLRVQRFTAVHEGPAAGAGSVTDMVTRAWELDSLGEAYEQWLTEATQLLAPRARRRRGRVRAAQRAGPRVAEVPVPRPGTPPAPASRRTGRGPRPRTTSRRSRAASCPRPRGTSTPASPADPVLPHGRRVSRNGRIAASRSARFPPLDGRRGPTVRRIGQQRARAGS